MKHTNTETGVTAEVETDLNPPVCQNSMAEGHVVSKIDRVYEATAEELHKAISDAPNWGDYAADLRTLAADLADRFEAIDPAFNRIEFLNVADPD